jgi:hypothetical protein
MNAIKIALALPIYQTANLTAYAKTREGWPARIATFVVFLPIIAVTTACWGAVWIVGGWLVFRLIN